MGSWFMLFNGYGVIGMIMTIQRNTEVLLNLIFFCHSFYNKFTLSIIHTFCGREIANVNIYTITKKPVS